MPTALCKWAGFSGLAIALVWGASGWGVARWSGEGITVGIWAGCLRAERSSPAPTPPAPGFEFALRTQQSLAAWDVSWQPRLETAPSGPGTLGEATRVRGLSNLAIPLWIPAAALCLTAAAAWHTHARTQRRRALPGHCRGCGHNRSRVAPYDPCPGCGEGGTIVVGADVAPEPVVEGEVERHEAFRVVDRAA